jgi:hypothetical protein
VRRGDTVVEDTGCNHPPWPKRECRVDLRKMGERASSSSVDRVRESTLMWLMLTHSNYTEWAMLMQCNFETLEIWGTIEPDGEGVKRARDRQAMGGILRSMPQEMW